MNSSQLQCPACGQLVPADAPCCMHCGTEFLPPAGVPPVVPSSTIQQQPEVQPQPQAPVPFSAADNCGVASLTIAAVSILMLGIWPLSILGAVVAIILGLYGLRGRNRGFGIAGI